jgi:hypothetical protein
MSDDKPELEKIDTSVRKFGCVVKLTAETRAQYEAMGFVFEDVDQ